MTHNATRALVAFVAFAAAAFAGFAIWTLDRREHATRQAGRAFEAQLADALVTAERLRAAQQAYVAEGQGSNFWMSRASEASAGLEQAITALTGAAISDELRDRARNAGASFEDVRRIDARARQWIQNEQRLMASDLIFTESLAASTAFADRLTGLREGHREAIEAELTAIRRNQVYALAGACAVVLIGVLLLAPAVRPMTPEDTREALRALIAKNSPPTLRAEPARVSTAQGSLPEASLTETSRAAIANPEPRAPVNEAESTAKPPQAIDIEAAAVVCSEMARVLDAAHLPGLLTRAAAVIGARGLVVWVSDTAGSMLLPTVAVGYAPAVIERLAGIRTDADNAAAAAYRHSGMQVVPARNGSAGAIVAPIVAADGCVGVLAAEVATGDEDEPGRRAVASILAAQLATIVTPLPEERQALHAQHG